METLTVAASDELAESTAVKPFRVLDLRDSPWVDGPGRTILDTASMVDARFSIVIGTFIGPPPGEQTYLREAKRRGLETCPIVERSAIDFAVLRQIVHWCRSHAIDVVHTHDFRSNLYGLVAARLLRIPAVATCHGWIANDPKGRLYTMADKFLLRFFERVIVVSKRMGGELQTQGIAARRIVVVRNALVVENFRPARADGVRTQWGIPAGHKLVGNIGRLSPEKCQDLFLRAAARVLSVVRDATFVLIGTGPEEERLRRLSAELGIASHVVFAGYRNDMQAVYNSLDLVVQSSSTEGMPNVILEALLMGVPVVATDVGGTAEIVDDGRSGWLVRANDLGSLVRAICEALADPASAQARADAGGRRVRAEFSHAERLQRIMGVYDDVLRPAAQHP